jgi:hypothetical protein
MNLPYYVYQAEASTTGLVLASIRRFCNRGRKQPAAGPCKVASSSWGVEIHGNCSRKRPGRQDEDEWGAAPVATGNDSLENIISIFHLALRTSPPADPLQLLL